MSIAHLFYLVTSFHHYDPNDIEYRWRDVGICVNDIDSLIEAVNRSFANPLEKAGLRSKYGPQLVGPIDGKAAERAGRAIQAVAMMEAEDRGDS